MKPTHVLSTLSLAILFAGLGEAGPITFQLAPSNGVVTGLAGQTVGWGFTLSNSGPDFLLVTGTSFVPAPLSSFGTFTDLLSPQVTAGATFLVIGPAPETPSLQEVFDPVLHTGVGELTLSKTAAGSVSGNIVVNYALFSVSPNNPNFNPDTDTIVPDASISAPAGAAISPEPGTLVLLSGAGLVCLLCRKHLRHDSATRTAARRSWPL
jgi:hypothetical protein